MAATAPIRNGSRSQYRVAHVVVLGASLAGLAAAASLARVAGRVTVLERDALQRKDGARKGVPQGRHVHLLLPSGVRALEALLPGFTGDLRRAGAELLREGQDFRIHVGGGRLRLDRVGPSFTLVGATRPLTESVIRERVRALPNVEVRGGTEALGLVPDASGRRVTGVRVRPTRAGAAERDLDADVVVDATGRGSRAPRWLAALGYGAPAEERVRVDVRYTTRLFRRHPDDRGARNVLVSVPPDGRRGGVALAVEGDRWIVTLVGMLGEQAPGDLDGFRAYARSLWSGALHDLVATGEPMGEAVTGAFPANSRRRYDRLRRFPGGFVVMGDALCPFNPLYAQGMSMAAMEARTLGRVLSRVGSARVGPAFFRASRAAVDEAWTQAVDNDLRHPAVEGPRTARWRVLGRYSDRLLPLAHRDPVVARALFEVMCLMRPGVSLMRPSISLRVLLRGGGGGAPAVSVGRASGRREVDA